jgi:hypothetical protein
MADTNVPAIVFSETGITLPQEASILAGVQADMNTAFGGNMSLSLTAPQGQIAQSNTAIIGNKNDQIAEVVNQVNPDTSSGRWQDAIGRIYFLDRIAASGTVVTGTIAGLVGAVIPVGSVAQDANGYRYSSLVDATITASGIVDVDFQCQTTGPVPCPIGALNTIFKAVTGWDSITNLSAGTEGTNVESRADFEFRRKNSVAKNSVNMVQSIQSAVLEVPNVLDAYVLDNPTGATVNKGSTNYPVIAHSVYVAAAGGEAEDIAKAIWSKKSGGCDYNGDTEFTVQDTEGYQQPYPSYVVKWVTPDALPIFFTVEIADDPALPANIVPLIRQAVVNAFNGTDGGTRARIGATLFAGRYYAGVAATDANVEIFSILLGSVSPGAGTALTVGIDQRPTLDPLNVTVTLV